MVTTPVPTDAACSGQRAVHRDMHDQKRIRTREQLYASLIHNKTKATDGLGVVTMDGGSRLRRSRRLGLLGGGLGVGLPVVPDAVELQETS